MKKLFTYALCAGALAAGGLFATSTEAAPKCPNGPNFTYVSRSPEECLAITFICQPGSQQFFNQCGCGCIQTGN